MCYHIGYKAVYTQKYTLLYYTLVTITSYCSTAGAPGALVKAADLRPLNSPRRLLGGCCDPDKPVPTPLLHLLLFTGSEIRSPPQTKISLASFIVEWFMIENHGYSVIYDYLGLWTLVDVWPE